MGSKNADGTTQQVNVPNLEVYDPKLDRWETRSPMPQAQGGLAATTLNGKLYVFGGEQWVPERKVFAESWVYDPETDVWKALPPLPTPRHGLGASAIGNRMLCVWWWNPNRRKCSNSNPRGAGIAHLERIQ